MKKLFAFTTVIIVSIIYIPINRDNYPNPECFNCYAYKIGDTLLPDYVHFDTLVVTNTDIMNDDSLWEHCDFSDQGIADILYKGCKSINQGVYFHPNEEIWPDDDYNWLNGSEDTLIVVNYKELNRIFTNWDQLSTHDNRDSISKACYNCCKVK